MAYYSRTGRVLIVALAIIFVSSPALSQRPSTDELILPEPKPKPKPKPPTPAPEPPPPPAKPAGPVVGEEREFDGMKFVWVPSGTFAMGSSMTPTEIESRYGGESKYYEDEHPQHEVTLTSGFWLGKYEVTKEQWERVMPTRPWKGKDYVKNDPLTPAVYVSWFDAQDFIELLNAKSSTKYRLPTEAEWEYACRAGSGSAFCFGNAALTLPEYAWFDGNADAVGEKYAHLEGRKKPNAWGLHDMHGNVYEWCEDWYSGGYYVMSRKADPAGPSSGSYRVVRGGSWLSDPRNCRAAYRHRLLPANAYCDVGFRICCVASAR